MEGPEEQKGEGDFTWQLGSRDLGLQACKVRLPDCSPASSPLFSARETLAVDWKGGRRKKPFCFCFRKRPHPWVTALRRCRGVSAAEVQECPAPAPVVPLCPVSHPPPTGPPAPFRFLSRSWAFPVPFPSLPSRNCALELRAGWQVAESSPRSPPGNSTVSNPSSQPQYTLQPHFSAAGAGVH